jgi:hypothetical protein
VKRVASALVLGMCLSVAAESEAAVTASGRNWRIAIGSVACEGASLLVIGARIGYLGQKGLVEAPVSQLVDGKGKRIPARSLVWKSGSRESARWLSVGGVADLGPGDLGEFLIKFDTQDTAGELWLEFGDIAAFALTHKGASAAAGLCEALLRPERIQAPRAPAGAGGILRSRIYREAYPCRSKEGPLTTMEARYPPYLPRQLLVLGRGYLPGARYIDLPMGRAPAQGYRYSGPDELVAVEDSARRAAADFPEYKSPKYFAFSWGLQSAPSGNHMYSIGFYELKPCPG